MSYYGSFVLQCYVLRMRVMTSTVGGNLTNRPPALRHIHVNYMMILDNIASTTLRFECCCGDEQCDVSRLEQSKV